MSVFWEDYYSILQVHYRAEPDMISTAYRRLSKRYHPDINRSKYAEDMMKRINLAYSVLIEAKKRAEYNREWLERMEKGKQASSSGAGSPANRPHTRIEDACAQLETYYRSISMKDYDAAYACISKADKKNIKHNDFLRWQTAVSKSVELGEVSVSFFKEFFDKRIGRNIYDEVIEFSVSLCEKDLKDNIIKEYAASKSMVFEKGEWRVYLGYSSVKPLIARFEDGKDISIDARAAVESWLIQQSKKDSLTLLPNISGFLEMSTAETARSDRYDNIFSVAAFEVVYKGNKKQNAESTEKMTIFAAKVIKHNLRNIDILCRWKDMKFFALLPETDILKASRAVNRICRAFNKKALEYDRNMYKSKKGDYYAIYAGTRQYDFESIESTMKKCNANLGLAKRTDRFRAVTGIYTRLRSIGVSGRFVLKRTRQIISLLLLVSILFHAIQPIFNVSLFNSLSDMPLLRQLAPISAYAVSEAAQPDSTAPNSGVTFSDVARGYWAYADVMSLASAGIVIGDGSGNFEPDRAITRGEFAVMLSLTLEKAAQGVTEQGLRIKTPQLADPTIHYKLDDLSERDQVYRHVASVRAYLAPHHIKGSGLRFEASSALIRSEAVVALAQMIDLPQANDSEVLEFEAIIGASELVRPVIRRAAATLVKYGVLTLPLDGAHASGGATGSTGVDGATGVAGASGVAGATGVAGIDGITGFDNQISRAEACVLICKLIRTAPWGEAIDIPEFKFFVPDTDSGFYDSFFDGAVFVGDSVSLGLRNYVLSQRARGANTLGGARFLAVGSYSLRASAADDFRKNKVNLTWQGKDMSIEDCLHEMDAKELYIMLGINEGLTGNPAYYRDLYIKTLDRVTAVNPDIRIRVQSCTPVTKSRESSGRSNTGIDRFNGLLLEMCENYGYDYIDISSPMKGEDNSFRTDYTSDNYVHMSSQGCVSWINSLLEFARQKYIDGEWTPDSSPEDFPGVWIDF